LRTVTLFQMDKDHIEADVQHRTDLPKAILETSDLEKREQILHDLLNQFGRLEILNWKPLHGHIAMLNDVGFAPWKGIVYLFETLSVRGLDEWPH
jgi:hypothetical protein